MAEIIVILVFVVIYLVCKANFNYKVDNYPISKVDSSKMISDKVSNNLSNAQVQRNMINGKYDKR